MYYTENKCRFVIGQKKEIPLICIGLNPSTATPSAPDPTYCKLMKIATNEKNNFKSIVVFNLYPYIATEPKDLPKQEDKEITKKNIEVIETVFNQFKKYEEPITICACWGAGIEKRTYLKECLKALILIVPLVLNGGAKATTLELLITNYIKRIKSVEFCEIVKLVNYIHQKIA